MHKKAHGYTPACFPQRRLIGDEGRMLEKAISKMLFATRIIKEVDEFLITYLVMVTNLNVYFECFEEFGKEFRVMREGQFEYGLYIKYFSIQLESDEINT